MNIGAIGGAHFASRTIGTHAACIEPKHARKVANLAQHMRREHDLPVRALNLPHQRCLAWKVEACEGLVEKQDLGLGDVERQEAKALPLSLAQRAYRAIGPSFELPCAEEIKRPPPRFFSAFPKRGQAEGELLQDGRKDDLIVGILKHDPDEPRKAAAVTACVKSLHGHGARIRK